MSVIFGKLLLDVDDEVFDGYYTDCSDPDPLVIEYAAALKAAGYGLTEWELAEVEKAKPESEDDDDA
jgi:hypothetical protein